MHREDEIPVPIASQSQPHSLPHQASSSPKLITINRYSQKFKDIIAKSEQARRVSVAPPSQPQPVHEPVPAVTNPDFFFFRVKSIGVGAHSFVYLVQEQKSKLLLSQKSVTKQHAGEIASDLVREIKLLFYLQHANIVQLYHVYQTQTHVNLIMEYAQDSLFALKQRFGTFKEKETVEIMRQLLLALEHIHRKSIVHADIKLENIMIANGTIKLVDFGLAHQHGKGEQQQEVVGTMEYLPPEYASGTDSGPSRDVWAVGILIFEMSVGKHPFDELKQNQKWSKLIKSPPETYFNELQEQHQALGKESPKVMELVQGIFLPWEKRWTARQLLQLPFFNVQ